MKEMTECNVTAGEEKKRAHLAVVAQEQCCRVDLAAQTHEVGRMMIDRHRHVRAYVRNMHFTLSVLSCARQRLQRV